MLDEESAAAAPDSRKPNRLGMRIPSGAASAANDDAVCPTVRSPSLLRRKKSDV
jgi:hypothetical protein